MLKQIHVGNIPMRLPEELLPAAQRLGGEAEFLRPPGFAPPRTVLDIGGGAGTFALWAYVHCEGAWTTTCEAHPLLCSLARENLPPGAVVHNVAVTAAEGGTVRVLARQGAVSEVPAAHPRTLPAAEGVRLNIGGSEIDVISHYPHWAGVRVLWVDWHVESSAHRGAAARLEGVGLRRWKAIWYRPDRGVEVWLRRV